MVFLPQKTKAVGTIWSYCDVHVHVQLEKGILHVLISAGF